MFLRFRSDLTSAVLLGSSSCSVETPKHRMYHRRESDFRNWNGSPGPDLCPAMSLSKSLRAGLIPREDWKWKTTWASWLLSSLTKRRRFGFHSAWRSSLDPTQVLNSSTVRRHLLVGLAERSLKATVHKVNEMDIM